MTFAGPTGGSPRRTIPMRPARPPCRASSRSRPPTSRSPDRRPGGGSAAGQRRRPVRRRRPSPGGPIPTEPGHPAGPMDDGRVPDRAVGPPADRRVRARRAAPREPEPAPGKGRVPQARAAGPRSDHGPEPGRGAGDPRVARRRPPRPTRRPTTPSTRSRSSRAGAGPRGTAPRVARTGRSIRRNTPTRASTGRSTRPGPGGRAAAGSSTTRTRGTRRKTGKPLARWIPRQAVAPRTRKRPHRSRRAAIAGQPPVQRGGPPGRPEPTALLGRPSPRPRHGAATAVQRARRLHQASRRPRSRRPAATGRRSFPKPGPVPAARPSPSWAGCRSRCSR